MSEKQIEQSLMREVTKDGGLCLKWVSPGYNGVPDRICLFNDGRIGFVEVKRPGAKPRRLQEIRHKQLRALGFKVFVLDDPADVPQIIDSIMEKTNGSYKKKLGNSGKCHSADSC